MDNHHGYDLPVIRRIGAIIYHEAVVRVRMQTQPGFMWGVGGWARGGARGRGERRLAYDREQLEQPFCAFAAFGFFVTGDWHGASAFPQNSKIQKNSLAYREPTRLEIRPLLIQVTNEPTAHPTLISLLHSPSCAKPRRQPFPSLTDNKNVHHPMVL